MKNLKDIFLQDPSSEIKNGLTVPNTSSVRLWLECLETRRIPAYTYQTNVVKASAICDLISCINGSNSKSFSRFLYNLNLALRLFSFQQQQMPLK